MSLPDITLALTRAIAEIEWNRSVPYQRPVETIQAWTRFEHGRKPNKQAQVKANEIRRIAGWPPRDYDLEFPE